MARVALTPALPTRVSPRWIAGRSWHRLPGDAVALNGLRAVRGAVYGFVAALLLTGWLIACAWAVGRVGPRLHGIPFAWVLTLSAVAFLAAAGGPLAGRALLRGESWTRAAAHLVAGAAFFAAAASAVGGHPIERAGVAGTILAGAFAEEFVFRGAAPYRLSAVLQRRWTAPWAWVTAQLVAQAAFALCHFATPAERYAAHPLAEGLRLFAAGLIYVVLVHCAGWWLAGGTHAALNFALATSVGAFPARVEPWQTALTCAAALAAVIWCSFSFPAATPTPGGRVTIQPEEALCR